MTKLDRMFEQFQVDALVTLVYAVVSPTGDVEFVNAGHCPPVVVTATGSRLLSAAPRPPLGTQRARTTPSTAHLDPGCALLLYTDGLAERRGEALDVGFARLVRHSALLRSGRLSDGLSELAHTMASDEAHDDIAAIAVRRGR